MSVVVAGPWDGSAFQNERKNLNGVISEYKYEYPIKMLQKAKAIKPNSSQDWAKMNGSVTGTMYQDVYKKPVGIVKANSYKPKNRVVANSAKMDSVSNYRGDYRGEKLTDRPKQIRPRSAHRDLSDNTSFYGDTEVGRSFRNFSENERKSARQRVKRIGSSYGHIDVKNTVKFNGASTNHDDYQGLPHERAKKIVPPNNNLKFGLEAGDNETNYRIDYAPIISGARQEPCVPVVTPKMQLKYDGPTITTHMQDYVGHFGARPRSACMPDRSYRPSTAPCEKDSAYTNSYKKWGAQKRSDMPWAEMAKKRTNLHGDAYNELPSSNYMIDYRNGTTLAKRQAIKPPQVTWSDRPPFQGQSQYQELFRGQQTDKVKNYKPNKAYSSPCDPLEGTSTARDSYRGEFILPPKSCKPEAVAAANNASMDSITEYRYRFH